MNNFYSLDKIEAGCDEVGRGCLAGPVIASAVIFPKNFTSKIIWDSKKMNEKQRLKARDEILENAIDIGIGIVDNKIIDKINILNASILAMHKALNKLKLKPELIIVDGNKFKPYKDIKYVTIIKGDSKYLSIAAASIIAKTTRDKLMQDLHIKYPVYDWAKNKAYPTKKHKLAIRDYGLTKYHRKTFNWEL